MLKVCAFRGLWVFESIFVPKKSSACGGWEPAHFRIEDRRLISSVEELEISANKS